jgi:hypothetical protein
MSSVKAQILEDKSGGIHWVDRDGGSYSVSGDDRGHIAVGGLLDELVSIEDWLDDARATQRDSEPGRVDTVAMNQEGMIVIAEIDVNDVVTIHVGRMGASGREYAGVHI